MGSPDRSGELVASTEQFMELDKEQYNLLGPSPEGKESLSPF
jgi:hypothetical protein